MKTQTAYVSFARLMDEQEVWKDPDLNFKNLCRRFRLPRRRLERLLLSELGYNGDGLLDVYRQNRYIC